MLPHILDVDFTEKNVPKKINIMHHLDPNLKNMISLFHFEVDCLFLP